MSGKKTGSKKKKNVNKQTSRYNRKSCEILANDLDNIEELSDLDSLDNLDFSFASSKEVENFKKNLGGKEKNFCGLIIFVLILICLGLASFLVYHFKSYDHFKVKVVKETVLKEVMDDNYLFLGDSITDFYDLDKYYEGLKVVNSGISGNTTEDILKDMKNRVYRYNPSKVFILIGINDLYFDSDSKEVISNIKEIVKSIKENRPYCKIYLESIYPVNNTDDDKIDHDMVSEKRDNKTVREINKELESFSKKEEITYIDMYSVLEDDDHNLKLDYTKEGLHLSDLGYEKVTEVLKKYIKE